MPSSRAPLSFLLPSKVTATLLDQTHSYTLVHTPDATFWMFPFFFLFLFFFFWSHGFRQWLSSKELGCNAGDTGDEGSISGLGRSSGGGNGNPPQYSCLEKVPWTEESGGLWSMGVTKESDMTEQLSLCSLWDLSSRTRDRTQAPCSESLES